MPFNREWEGRRRERPFLHYTTKQTKPWFYFWFFFFLLPHFYFERLQNGTPNALDDACWILSAYEVRQRGHPADGIFNNSSVRYSTVPSASTNTRGCRRVQVWRKWKMPIYNNHAHTLEERSRDRLFSMAWLYGWEVCVCMHANLPLRWYMMTVVTLLYGRCMEYVQTFICLHWQGWGPVKLCSCVCVCY